MYDPQEIDVPNNDDNWSMSGSFVMKSLREVAGNYTSKEIRAAKRAFYATCTHIDHQIRMLIGTLRESNMLEDTIIVFLSDHGDMLFDHNMVGKRVFYENSANVPLIFSGAPLQKYRDIDRKKLCTLADVMPTLLNLCGIDIPATAEGIPIFGDKRHEMIYCEIAEGNHATRMVHDGRYKLIYYPAGNLFHLFDLESDPLEKRNLAGEAEVSAILKKLTGYLIKNLYNTDENWLKEGKLAGFAAPEFTPKVDFGMHNQRGTHWPPPTGYLNF
jgi:arylsulfatase